MAVILNYPLFHADDDNGAPLTGGLLYTYIAGTSTAQATYTTSAMTTANTNPVVLNSRGEAVIYASGLYKLILKTSAGVTVWTEDNVELGLGEGAIKRAKFTYNGGTVAYTVKVSAAMYNVGNKVAEWVSELTTEAIASPVASTRYYLYLDYSAITSGLAITAPATELIWSITPPTYSHTLGGWYNGDDLCIFGVITNATPDNILEFFHDGGDLVMWANNIAEATTITPSDTWTDVDCATVGAPSVPAFSTKILVTLRGIWRDTVVSLDYKTNNQSGWQGHAGVTVSPASLYANAHVIIITDASQVFEVRFASPTVLNSCDVYTDGWYFPAGM